MTLSVQLPSSGRHLPCYCDSMYFKFASHCSWGVLCPTNLHPLLDQEIIPETYKTPPPPSPLLQRHAFSTVNGSLQPSHIRGVLFRGRSRHHFNASLNFSLERSPPFWELGRTVNHTLLAQSFYSF